MCSPTYPRTRASRCSRGRRSTGRTPLFDGAGSRQLDRKGDVRGIALKIVGVEGTSAAWGARKVRTMSDRKPRSAITVRVPITMARSSHGGGRAGHGGPVQILLTYGVFAPHRSVHGWLKEKDSGLFHLHS
jgi:hypothetical protein